MPEYKEVKSLLDICLTRLKSLGNICIIPLYLSYCNITSTSHKKTPVFKSVRPCLMDFNKILPSIG